MIGLGLGGAVVLTVGLFFLLKGKSENGGNGGDGSASSTLTVEDRGTTRNRLKVLGLALHNYHDVYRTFPPGSIYDLQDKGHHSWQTSLLPYVDQTPLFQSINTKIPWDDSQNVAFFQNEISAYCRASDEPQKNGNGLGLSHWAANQYVMNRNTKTGVREFTDGLTNTILVGEVVGNFSPWGQPGNWRDLGKGINKGPETFGNPAADNGLFLMGDGAVRLISEDVDPEVLRRLADHQDGQPIDAAF